MGSQTTNLATPYYEPGARITGRALGAAVIGKRFVAVAGKKAPAAPASTQGPRAATS